jgi:glycyl-tRNA synthetase
MRPETAQGIFVELRERPAARARKKPPFGIAQIGKSFRNEITPGNFIFRTREFEQMEMEFFVEPGTDEEWHQYWIDERWTGTSTSASTREPALYEHPQGRSCRTTPSAPSTSSTASGLRGLGGPSSRASPTAPTSTSRHAQRALRHRPVVLRPGEGRALPPLRHRAGSRASPARRWRSSRRLPRGRGARTPRAASTSARCCGSTRGSRRQGRRAAAVAQRRPLAEGQGGRRRCKREWNVEFDDAQAIGRRYRRQDEIGTPFCVTVDFDTLEDHAVTVRERDTMAAGPGRDRRLVDYLAERLPR